MLGAVRGTSGGVRGVLGLAGTIDTQGPEGYRGIRGIGRFLGGVGANLGHQGVSGVYWGWQ